jgi:prepilin-type N-terminal cleavage/methylation domain-containing protein
MRSTPVRDGFTLLEAMVALTVLSVVLASAAIALNTIYRAEETVRRHRRTAENLSRLELRLRRDVHRADRLHFVEDEQADGGDRRALRLEMGGEELIEYHAVDDRVRRETRRGEEMLQRDTFYIEGFSPSWESPGEAPTDGRSRPSYQSFALVLTRRLPDGRPPAQPPLRIEIALRQNAANAGGEESP